MTAADRELLARIVTAIETLWWPVRYRMDERPVDRAFHAVMHRRRDYRSGLGLDWRVGGSAADRQSGSRALRRLATSGAITLRRGTVQRCGVLLRDIDACMSVTPNRLLSQAWPQLERVAMLTDDPAVMRNGLFVTECAVADIPPDCTESRLPNEFAFDALPLLIAGYLQTASDVAGRLGWRVTKSGKRAMVAGPPKSTLLEYCPKIGAMAERLAEIGLEERSSWTPENHNDLHLPLSAGRWSQKLEAVTDGC